MTSLQLVDRIVFFGGFGPPSLIFARSAYAMGIAVYLLTPKVQSSRAKVPSSCFAGAEVFDASLVGDSRGIDAVVDYVRRIRAQALATISDAHCLWFARNRARFQDVCKLLVPPIECLELVESKTRQIHLAREVGLKVLPTYEIRRLDDVEAIESDHYPICLRPAVPDAIVPPFKLRLARSRDELRRLLQDIKSFNDCILAQPFHAVPNMVVHCTSREGGELMTVDTFLVDRKFEGLALRIRRMKAPESLEDKLRKFSANLGLCGAYHYDFLLLPHCSEPYYLEVNVRFGGTTDKVIWLGVDEPANSLKAYGLASPAVPRRFAAGRRAVVNKRFTLKHIWTMIRRGPNPWDYPQESRWWAVLRSLADLVIAKDSIADYQDLRGTFAFHVQGFRP